jgi:hypothetical protein
MQKVELKVAGDPKAWPEYICARKDGSLFVQDLPKRTRVFGYLYKDLLLRYDLVLAVSRDLYQTAEDDSAFRWAIKNLPVPSARAPTAEALSRVDRYYDETPARAKERRRMEQVQASRRYSGDNLPQVKLPGEPFPPPHVFYEGDPLAPAVHLAIKDVFGAIARHPMFGDMPGVSYLVDAFPKGQVLLVGFPTYDAATLTAFLRTLKQYERKPARAAKAEAPNALPGRSTIGRGESKAKRLDFVAGLLYGRYLSSEALADLAAIPSLDTVHGQLVGAVADVAGRQLVGTLANVASAGRQIVGVLSQAGGGDVLNTLEGRRRTLEEESKKWYALPVLCRRDEAYFRADCMAGHIIVYYALAQWDARCASPTSAAISNGCREQGSETGDRSSPTRS